MTRDETVALFLQGKEAWNAWAKKKLAERKALEEAGRWQEEKDSWSDTANADFSDCLFRVRGAEGTKEASGEADKEEVAEELHNKSLSLGGEKIEFESFIFPGLTNFKSAAIEGYADFGSTTFEGDANFEYATFKGYADFESATFLGDANF